MIRALCCFALAVLWAATPCVDLAGEGASTVEGEAVSYPGPGWKTASPRTRITFRGIGVRGLRGVRVTGSASGPHAGRLHALRRGAGAVFTPETAFRPGERITVQTPVRVYGASGHSFSFTTARPVSGAFRSDIPHVRQAARAHESPHRTGESCGQRGPYRTLPTFHPVAVCMTGRPSANVSPGRLLITPRPVDRHSDEEWAAVILSRTGKLLWYAPYYKKVNDLKTVLFHGRPLLALFSRPSRRVSYYELLNERYELVKRVVAGNGFRVDSHELQKTPRGTVYLGAYERVRVAKDRKVTDYVVQEVDLATRDVLFEWHSLDHVRPSASYKPRPAHDEAWDYFHGNSIEPPSPHGRTIIVSARNTSAVYGVDRRTGAVRWILGGKRDQFGVVHRHPQRRFCAQHDARWLPDGDLTIFDNGGTWIGRGKACPVHAARVLRFRLDAAKKKAHLVSSISSKPSSPNGAGYFPYAVGSARRQPNRDMLINWGSVGRITEVTPTGRVKFRLALGKWTYRAVRAPWTGRPGARPAVAAHRRAPRAVDVWASWNGATQIRRWQALAGGSPTTLQPIGRPVPFADLETRIRVRTAATYVAVQALNSEGVARGQSAAVRTE